MKTVKNASDATIYVGTKEGVVKYVLRPGEKKRVEKDLHVWRDKKDSTKKKKGFFKNIFVTVTEGDDT